MQPNASAETSSPLFPSELTKHFSEPERLLYKSAELCGTPTSPPVWLIIIVIHFDWPK